MSSPPSTRRIDAETFEGAPEWFRDNFLPLLNNFMGDAQACFARGLDADENLRAAFVEDYQLVTGATVANSFPLYLEFPAGLGSWTPRDVRVTKVETPDTPLVVLTSPVWCQWDVVDRNRKSVVRIRTITGLAVSTKYRLCFRLE